MPSKLPGLRTSLEAVIGDVEVRGEGALSLPEHPVPPVQAGDMDRDPAEDYAESGGHTRAWIRRAAHAERFARALEAELERLRGACSRT